MPWPVYVLRTVGGDRIRMFIARDAAIAAAAASPVNCYIEYVPGEPS